MVDVASFNAKQHDQHRKCLSFYLCEMCNAPRHSSIRAWQTRSHTASAHMSASTTVLCATVSRQTTATKANLVVPVRASSPKTTFPSDPAEQQGGEAVAAALVALQQAQQAHCQVATRSVAAIAARKAQLGSSTAPVTKRARDLLDHKLEKIQAAVLKASAKVGSAKEAYKRACDHHPHTGNGTCAFPSAEDILREAPTLTAEGLGQLQMLLGYHFKTPELLQQACRVPQRDDWLRQDALNNDRLALEGDRVLDLAAQSLAIDARPLVPGSRLARADKKELVQAKIRLITREACTRSAREVGLHAVLDSGGAPVTDAMLAEAFEAVIGAVFRDGGYDEAVACWHRLRQDDGSQK